MVATLAVDTVVVVALDDILMGRLVLVRILTQKVLLSGILRIDHLMTAS